MLMNFAPEGFEPRPLVKCWRKSHCRGALCFLAAVQGEVKYSDCQKHWQYFCHKKNWKYFSRKQISGEWRGGPLHDLLPNHRMATCLNCWPKDRGEHGHVEQVCPKSWKFNTDQFWCNFFWISSLKSTLRLDAAAFPTLITEFLSLHPSLESPGKEEPPRKKVVKRS